MFYCEMKASHDTIEFSGGCEMDFDVVEMGKLFDFFNAELATTVKNYLRNIK